jgi:hypothetical protein
MLVDRVFLDWPSAFHDFSRSMNRHCRNVEPTQAFSKQNQKLQRTSAKAALRLGKEEILGSKWDSKNVAKLIELAKDV